MCYCSLPLLFTSYTCICKKNKYKSDKRGRLYMVHQSHVSRHVYKFLHCFSCSAHKKWLKWCTFCTFSKYLNMRRSAWSVYCSFWITQWTYFSTWGHCCVASSCISNVVFGIRLNGLFFYNCNCTITRYKFTHLMLINTSCPLLSSPLLGSVS